MRILSLILVVASISINLFAEANIETQKNMTNPNNIWLKTYVNYKNHNKILTNIAKVEEEIGKIKNKNNFVKIQELNNKLNIYKSKLSLYEKNNSFDTLMKKYTYEIREITLYDYLFTNSLEELEKKRYKYESLKKDFYTALSYLQSSYSDMIQLNPKDKKILFLEEQIDYISEYSENIEKKSLAFLELTDDLKKKYLEYKNEVFIKHLTTLAIIIVFYLSYKLLLFFFFYFTQNKETHDLEKNYRKILSLFFVLTILIFIVIRYINDLIYIVTLLGFIAAALTLALREIILNIAGAIYLFFSNLLREGDRIMVQFETKHTIGDIVNISLIKIKLNEVDDYTSIKEVKNVGRTIYIPNSYIFTKVFYNYSLKKNGIVNDLIEFEFEVNNDFKIIEQTTKEVFDNISIPYSISFSLNSTKNGIIGIISYQINYKIATQKRGEISIDLLKKYTLNKSIRLKSLKKNVKKEEEE